MKVLGSCHCVFTFPLFFFHRGYESGSGAGGCSGLFCWNNRRPHGRRKVSYRVSTLYTGRYTCRWRRLTLVFISRSYKVLLHVRPKVDDFLCSESVLNRGTVSVDDTKGRSKLQAKPSMCYYIWFCIYRLKSACLASYFLKFKQWKYIWCKVITLEPQTFVQFCEPYQ